MTRTSLVGRFSWALICVAATVFCLGCGKAKEEVGVGPLPGTERTFAGIEFVWCPPGTFMMGSPENEAGRSPNEGPQHQVTLTKGFWLSKYEVTQGLWTQVRGRELELKSGEDHPVRRVSWENVQIFMRQLNARGEGTFRLPTEAEWEYACRAGSTTRYSFGDDPDLTDLTRYAWYKGNNGGDMHPVGEKEQNAWGLCDMHGNVAEWCQDWYGDYSSEPATDPTGPAQGTERVIRSVGVGRPHDPTTCRSAYRAHSNPSKENAGAGFRVCRLAVEGETPEIQPGESKGPVASRKDTGSAKDPKAQTPKEAMVSFATAMEQGNVSEMKAAAHYTDDEGTTAVFTVMAELLAFEKALDKAYGKAETGQVQMSPAPSFPTLEQINSDDLKVDEQGDKATAYLLGKPDKKTHLIKKDDYWYVDESAETPTGEERARVLQAAKTVSGVMEEAKEVIGQPGVTRQELEMELFGGFLGAAMGFTGEPEPPPAGYASWRDIPEQPLPDDDPVAAAVRELNDATNAGDVEKMKGLVAEDCEVSFEGMGMKASYWSRYNDQYPEQFKQAQKSGEAFTSVIEQIKLLERTPDQVTVRVTSASKSAYSNSRDTGRYVYKNYDGTWKLAQMIGESTEGQFGAPGMSGTTRTTLSPTGEIITEELDDGSSPQRMREPDSSLAPAPQRVAAPPIGATEQPDSGPAPRTLAFPEDRIVGGVYIRNSGSADSVPWERWGNAKSSLVIPAESEVRLSVRSSELSFLDAIGENDLQALSLRELTLEDEELAHVAHLLSLESLDLRKSSISDAALKYLTGLSELKELDLTGTAVSDSGIAELKKALPDCRIAK